MLRFPVQHRAKLRQISLGNCCSIHLSYGATVESITCRNGENLTHFDSPKSKWKGLPKHQSSGPKVSERVSENVGEIFTLPIG